MTGEPSTPGGLGARLFRSAAWVTGAFGVSQALRLLANLLLTRLLAPEAFGLMALVTVFLVGLMMLSDIGVGPAIQRHPRGDDPEFLDTAWTIQLLRGALLWLVCCALALPAARLYGQPDLAAALPVAGLTLIASGLSPTRVEGASRRLIVGRVEALNLLGQVVGLLVTLALALWLRSVWALVWGMLAGAVARLALMHLLLPGRPDRLDWRPDVAAELLSFGGWIFLSTLCGFLVAQGDKAILGLHLPIDRLGVYNIGFFLASFPSALALTIAARLVIPVYRERPPTASRENFEVVRRIRAVATAAILGMQAGLVMLGDHLARLLYDDRFADAGAVVIAVGCASLPHLVGVTYERATLAAGDARGMFLLSATRAATQMAGFLIGIELGGLPGALAGQAVAGVGAHLMVVRVARRLGVWDPLHDAAAFAAAGLIAGGALWIKADALAPLAGFAGGG